MKSNKNNSNEFPVLKKVCKDHYIDHYTQKIITVHNNSGKQIIKENNITLGLRSITNTLDSTGHTNLTLTKRDFEKFEKLFLNKILEVEMQTSGLNKYDGEVTKYTVKGDFDYKKVNKKQRKVNAKQRKV